MSYLKGNKEEITTSNLRKLVGEEVVYLRNVDIDKSGRGVFFPRHGTLTSVYKRQVEFDNTMDFIPFKDLVELVVVKKNQQNQSI